MKKLTEKCLNLLKEFEATYYANTSKREQLGIEIFEELGLYLIRTDYSVNEVPILLPNEVEARLKILYDPAAYYKFMFQLNPSETST